MGEPRSDGRPPPGGCCLDPHEAALALAALIVAVQLALRLAAAVCSSVFYFLGTVLGTIFAKEPEKLPAAPARGRKPCSRRASMRWSEEEVPRRRRREGSLPPRHCVHCTLEPVKLTMNLCRAGRRPLPDCPPCHLLHCCACENRHRQRTSSAPSGCKVTRCREVACGTSDTMLVTSGKERRPLPAPGPEPYPWAPVGETQYYPTGPPQDTDYVGGAQRTRRPTKVYIYPVHPPTPPGSRSASPERSYRRRGAISGGQEELQEYETREQRQQPRHKSREVEHQADAVPPPPSPPPSAPPPPLSRFRNAATRVMQGMAAPQEPPQAKQRYRWPDVTAASDWVYRPMK